MTKGDTGSEAPIWRVIEPPLLPGKTTSGPFKSETTVPGFATSSYKAVVKENPRDKRIISPVADRDPSEAIVTVPPVAPWLKAPKLSPWAVTVTVKGRGGGSCPLINRLENIMMQTNTISLIGL